MEQSPPKKLKRQPKLTYVNDFIAKANKKLISVPQKSQQKACGALSAILSQNKSLIKKYSSEGIPEEIPILRAYIWKILLHFLPDEPKKWEETIKEKRGEYNTYKKFIKGRLETELKEKKYKSKEILEQIIKDVYRTNSENPFFY
jgi:hypothetical protein